MNGSDVEIVWLAGANSLTSYDNYLIRSTGGSSGWSHTRIENVDEWGLGTFSASDELATAPTTEGIVAGIEISDYQLYFIDPTNQSYQINTPGGSFDTDHTQIFNTSDGIKMTWFDEYMSAMYLMDIGRDGTTSGSLTYLSALDRVNTANLYARFYSELDNGEQQFDYIYTNTSGDRKLVSANLNEGTFIETEMDDVGDHNPPDVQTIAGYNGYKVVLNADGDTMYLTFIGGATRQSPFEDGTFSKDTDGGGIPDEVDLDDDGDGVSDRLDAFPLDASESLDTDGDGRGNNEDSDDDNDGVSDYSDRFPLDASEAYDSDYDGVGNNSDAFPYDYSETRDSDSDGVGDNNDAFPFDETETRDSDGDGVGDNNDFYPYDASRSESIEETVTPPSDLVTNPINDETTETVSDESESVSNEESATEEASIESVSVGSFSPLTLLLLAIMLGRNWLRWSKKENN